MAPPPPCPLLCPQLSPHHALSLKGLVRPFPVTVTEAGDGGMGRGGRKQPPPQQPTSLDRDPRSQNGLGSCQRLGQGLQGSPTGSKAARGLKPLMSEKAWTRSGFCEPSLSLLHRTYHLYFLPCLLSLEPQLRAPCTPASGGLSSPLWLLPQAFLPSPTVFTPCPAPTPASDCPPPWAPP